MDRKDHLIAILQQQRDDAHNRLANVMAEANARIAELMSQSESNERKIKELEKQLLRVDKETTS